MAQQIKGAKRQQCSCEQGKLFCTAFEVKSIKNSDCMFAPNSHKEEFVNESEAIR